MNEPQIPEYDLDPAEHLKTRLDRLESNLTQEHTAQVVKTVQEAERQFVEQGHDDYHQALDHIRQKEHDRLLLQGIPPERIPQELSKIELETAQRLLRAGRNPAEAVYNLARESYGFESYPSHGDEDRPTLAEFESVQAEVFGNRRK
jgi:hypothetical protein